MALNIFFERGRRCEGGSDLDNAFQYDKTSSACNSVDAQDRHRQAVGRERGSGEPNLY